VYGKHHPRAKATFRRELSSIIGFSAVTYQARFLKVLP
jgi:hypothetical protein